MRSLLIGILLLVYCPLNAQILRVMTYNIRVDIPSDSLNSWEDRKHRVVQLLRFYEPAIFGIQEGLPHQVYYLDSLMKKYTFVGKGRDGGTKGEYSAIFYDMDKFKIIMDSTLWLSETPHTPSVGWDAALNRVLTLAIL